MPLGTPYMYALILSLIQSNVDERPTLCYPLNVDVKYILPVLLEDEAKLGCT